MPLYADIVLPLAQPAYTFAVPEGMHVEAGQAVAVQFGARKFYTGIVWRVHDRRPPFKTVKSIQRVLYGAPLLSAQQMAFWEWVAAYRTRCMDLTVLNGGRRSCTRHTIPV